MNLQLKVMKEDWNLQKWYLLDMSKTQVLTRNEHDFKFSEKTLVTRKVFLPLCRCKFKKKNINKINRKTEGWFKIFILVCTKKINILFFSNIH